MPPKIAILFAASFFVLSGSACGYLDNDLFVDDEAFGQSLDLESSTIRGHGVGVGSVYGFGCGGIGIYGRGHSSSGIAAVGHGRSVASMKPLAQMTDAEVLEHTDVEMIAEPASGDDVSAQPGSVEYIYRAQMAKRDEAVLGVYASE